MATEVTIVIDSNRVRGLAKICSKRVITTPEAEAFLLLHGDQLQDAMRATLMKFVTDKLGKFEMEFTQLSSQDQFRVLNKWPEELRKARLTGQPLPSLDEVSLDKCPNPLPARG